MGVFQDLEIEWDGKIKTIKARTVMRLISQMEEIFTLPELEAYAIRGTIPLARLAMTYGVALRFAGFRIEDDEIYERMFSSTDQQETITGAIINIMSLMLPPAKRKDFMDVVNGVSEPPDEEISSGNSQPAKASSSRSIKPRSVKRKG